MKNPFILTIILSLFTSFIFAQTEVTVTGTVLDKDVNQPLEYATIVFFSKKENRIVTGGITDASGNFSIVVPSGTYDVSVEYISYKTKSIPNKVITKDTDLGILGIAIDVESLGEVQVIAERTTVEIKLPSEFILSIVFMVVFSSSLFLYTKELVIEEVSLTYHSTPTLVVKPKFSRSVSLYSFKNVLGSLPLKYSVSVNDLPGDSR